MGLDKTSVKPQLALLPLNKGQFKEEVKKINTRVSYFEIINQTVIKERGKDMEGKGSRKDSIMDQLPQLVVENVNQKTKEIQPCRINKNFY